MKTIRIFSFPLCFATLIMFQVFASAQDADELVELNKEIEALKLEIEAIKEATAANEESSEVKSKLTSLSESILADELKLRKSMILISEYKDKYRIKTNFFMGETLGNLSLKSGNSYQGVTVKEIFPSELRVGHSGGFAVIKFSDLPDTLASKFSSPPSIPSANVDVQATLNSRPASLDLHMASNDEESEDPIKTTERPTQDQRLADAKKKRIERAESAEKERNERIAEAEAMTNLRKKIYNIDEEINTIKKAIAAQESARSRIIYEAQQRKTKLAGAQLKKLTDPYDLKVAQLNTQVNAKLNERRNLAAQLK